MITIDQAIDRFLNKSEKNGTNDNIAVDKKRICLLYNEGQNKFMSLHLQNRKIDDARYIQNFLILDKSIPYISKEVDKYHFELPKDQFDISDLRVNANKDDCARIINCIPTSAENVSEILQDEFLKPSFECDETIFTVNSNQVSVYTDTTFKISEALLSYYRYPSQLKLIDDFDPESPFDSASKIEWDDKCLDDIISLMVFNLDINQNNPRYQLQTLRTQK